MDFIPKSNWQWVFDNQRAILTLQMGDYLIDITYKSNMLVLPDDKPLPFTIEDVARYTQLFESVALNGYEPEFSCKIVSHILAIELFHKPIMPKSWLFSDNSLPVVSAIDLMSHISLTAEKSSESAHYLVLEDDQEFALCLLIDQIHQLTPRKSIKQFQLIKVTIDKLTLIKTADESNLGSGHTA